MLMKLMMLCGGALMGIAMAAQVEWMQDLEKASALAKAQNKLLLVEFTGSDWCRACLIQKKRVLSQIEFEEWVQKHCIAVEVDVPHDVKRVGGHAQKQKNEKICEAYDIKNFPSLLLKLSISSSTAFATFIPSDENTSDKFTNIVDSYVKSNSFLNILFVFTLS